MSFCDFAVATMSLPQYAHAAAVTLGAESSLRCTRCSERSAARSCPRPRRALPRRRESRSPRCPPRTGGSRWSAHSRGTPARPCRARRRSSRRIARTGTASPPPRDRSPTRRRRKRGGHAREEARQLADLACLRPGRHALFPDQGVPVDLAAADLLLQRRHVEGARLRAVDRGEERGRRRKRRRHCAAGRGLLLRCVRHGVAHLVRHRETHA